MTLEAREKAIENFRHKPEIYKMICSLKADDIGLNLAVAFKASIGDIWFNSSVEAQTYCRASRTGQESKVKVFRLASRFGQEKSRHTQIFVNSTTESLVMISTGLMTASTKIDDTLMLVWKLRSGNEGPRVRQITSWKESQVVCKTTIDVERRRETTT